MVEYISLDDMKEVVVSLDTYLKDFRDADLKLEMMETVLNEFKYIPDKINFIRTYIRMKQAKIRSLVSTKNNLEKIKEYELVGEIRAKIKNVKEDLELIRSVEIVKNYAPRTVDKKRISYKDLMINSESIKKLDEVLEIDNYALIVNLNNIDDLDEQLRVLNGIKDKYLKRQYVLKDLYKYAVKKNYLVMLEDIKKLKRTKTLVLEYIDTYISYVNALVLSNSRKDKDYNKVFGNKIGLTPRQQEIRSLILDNDFRYCYNDSIEDLLVSFKDIIYKEDIVKNNEVISEFIDYFNERTNEDDTCILSIIDSFKNKKKKLGKDKSVEKTLIKNYIEKLNNILIVNDDAPFFEEDAVNYEIFTYLLSRPNNYYCIKNLVSRNPDFLNLRYNGKHIIVDILEKYVESSKDELRNQKKDYIKKEYYKSLYNLFKNSSNIQLFEEDNIELSKIYDNFIVYLENKKYNPELKTKAIVDIDNMFLSSDLKEIEFSEELEDYLTYTKAVIGIMANGKDRVIYDRKYFASVEKKIDKYYDEFALKYDNLPSRELVCQELGISSLDYENCSCDLSVEMIDGKHAYSISNDLSGNTYLRMHVLDMSSVVKEHDLLDIYLNETLGNGKVDIINFNCGGVYPTVTYELKVYPNGYVGDFNVYKSKVVIDSCVDNLSSRKYIKLYKIITKSKDEVNIGDIDKYFNSLMNDGIKSYAKFYGLPIIMSGVNKFDESGYFINHSELGHVFSQLDDKQYAMYVDVLGKNLDESHYINDNYNDGEFNYSFDSCNSYIDLFNQRILIGRERLINNMAELDNAIKESNNIVNMANNNIGYVSNTKVKINRKYKKK